MAARLGRVLYWTGILVGLIAGGIIAATVVSFDARDLELWGIGAITGAVCFAIPYLIGRACRFVLAGY